MDFIIYLILILSIIALFVVTNYYYAPIIYGTVIVLSLFGFIMSLSSPIEVETGEFTEVYNYTSSCGNTTGDCIESINTVTQYEKVPLINEAISLLFIAFFITAIYIWVIENKEE